MTVIGLTIGGGLGAIFRYLAGMFFARFQKGVPFPVSMLLVNVIGSFSLGLLTAFRFEPFGEAAAQDSWFLFAGIGFFGAFTTFSTFSVEAFQLLEQRNYRAFCLYTGLSTAGAFLCFALGWQLGG
ncbi:fluoride efflux transporter CrcB [Salibacterium qingdaonense]|uniref:Fluoride-specific ion channel FluC n=1 Tax=Salibacterium qingdaonense TaxID=266892 RepID=A0A1I4I4I0_9BACI|nr:fluoride efflux transporter CrcB [Salibacterium qingdaonense]SFL48636.1 CrcB protein [Salibacterium qingdaonense]